MNMTRNTLDKVLGWIYLLASSVSYRRVILHWKNSEREVVKQVALNKMVYGIISGRLSRVMDTQSTNYSFLYSVAKRCFSSLIQFCYSRTHGKRQTLQRIQQRFYWSSMLHDVGSYCRSCPECQKVSTARQHWVPLIPLPIMKESFERIAIDIVELLPHSHKGYPELGSLLLKSN